MYERDSTIDAVFSRRALEQPAAIAVVGARVLTYGEVERDANRVANALIARGIGRGATVGVAFERSVDLPSLLLGILRAGAAYVPLDPSYPAERTALMVEDAAVGLIVIEAPTAGFPQTPAAVVTAATLLSHADDRRPPATGGPASLAYVMYTSGSTGRPKGVAIEHRSVVRLVRGTNYVSIAADDAFLHLAPLAFDASTFELWAPLLNGARLAIADAGMLTIDQIAATIERNRVTTLWLAASMFREVVEGGSAAFGSLRQLLVGGDVVSPAHARRFIDAFPGCRLINGYGPTENTTFSCCYPIPSAAAIADGVPIGRPIEHSTAYVLDDDLRPVSAGSVGELYVGGDGVARGYLNLAVLTAERFIPDPFSGEPGARLFRTGDRVRVREDGVLEFCGRTDNQVKVRGFRVELGEIETVLRTHPAVRDAAALAGESSGYKEIVAHVALEPGASFDERDLRAYLGRSLPQYMLPNRIVVRAALPRNPSGKLDRAALEVQQVTTLPSAAPRFVRGGDAALLEQTIGSIWRELLGGEGSLDENFFDAGGDSLRLLAMHARLRQRLNVDLSVNDLFEQSTIRKLASFVARSQVRA